MQKMYKMMINRPMGGVSNRAAAALMLVVLALALGSCTVHKRSPLKPLAGASDRAAMSQGEAAFLAGETAVARKTFSRLAQNAAAPDVRQAARYGMVCADMVQAPDAAAFRAAVESFLHQFLNPALNPALAPVPDPDSAQKSVSGFADVNPALLARGLSRGMVLEQVERKSAHDNAVALQAKERKWKKEKKKMQHLINTLQHQITVLERIDQERQEKRKVQ